MRKLILIILFIFFSLSLVFAQSYNRNYVGLAIGPSFPNGDFVKTDLYDSTSGWAKTGVALAFSYAHRFTHNFGLIVMITYSGNSFNGLAYGDALMQSDTNYSVSVESAANWSGGGIMIGPYFRFPLGDKLSWDFRGLFGFYGSNSPQLTVRATKNNTDPPEKSEYFRQRSNAYSYVYSFGTGFKYRLSKYYVLLFVDYLKSPLKFDNASGWDWNNEPYQTKFTQEISYVDVTIGLGYFF